VRHQEVTRERKKTRSIFIRKFSEKRRAEAKGYQRGRGSLKVKKGEGT